MSSATDQRVDFNADQGMGLQTMFSANNADITADTLHMPGLKTGLQSNIMAPGLAQQVEFADAHLLQGMDEMKPPMPDDSLGLSIGCRAIENVMHGPQAGGMNGMMPQPHQQLNVQPPQPAPFML